MPPPPSYDIPRLEQDTKVDALSHRKTINSWRMTFVLCLMLAAPSMIVMYVVPKNKSVIVGLKLKPFLLFVIATPGQVSELIASSIR